MAHWCRGSRSNSTYDAQAEGQCELMAKKVTVTLVDDFDGEGAADETVEFGLDGVSYEIDLSSKNAAKLRNDLKQWVDAGRRVGGRGAGARPDGPRAGQRSTASRARRSGSGRAATGTTCPPAGASPPTSSTRSTRQRNRHVARMPAPASASLVALSLAANWSRRRPRKRFGRARRCSSVAPDAGR